MPAPPQQLRATGTRRWRRQREAHGGPGLGHSWRQRQGVARHVGLRGTEALPARRRPAPRHVPATASRMRAHPLAPITDSRSAKQFTREQGRPAHRAPRLQ